MEVDQRVARRYRLWDESSRLWRPGVGALVRLRTWDIFDRTLAPGGRILDVGGGPGTHAAHLAQAGHTVTLIDPFAHHVEQARQRCLAQPEAPFTAGVGEARRLPVDTGSIDAVLLMGPLYHLPEPADRLAALREAGRVLRPDGRLLAEVITRHAWLLDATAKDRLNTPGIWETFDLNITSGLSVDPARLDDGGFWANFHHPDDLHDELEQAGFAEIELIGVEGHAWLIGDLETRMQNPEPILRAVQLVEREPSLLGTSAHVIGAAIAP
jgi:SAM-dependent methyltransferase